MWDLLARDVTEQGIEPDMLDWKVLIGGWDYVKTF